MACNAYVLAFAAVLVGCGSDDAGGGSVAPGGSCSSSKDCAPSNEGRVTCTPNKAKDPAFVCSLQIEGKDGDTPCLGTTSKSGNGTDYSNGKVSGRGYVCPLANGLYCASTGGCAMTKAVGAACESADAFACADDGFCSEGKCVAR